LIRTAIRIHGRIHPPSQRIAARRAPSGRRPNQLTGAPVRAAHKTTNDHEEASMTAYLISLSLAGLVAIAVWEALL